MAIKISLRWTIGGMSGLSVIVVCTIVLTLVTILNRNFSEKLGEEHAASLGELARFPTEEFFNHPAMAVREVQRVLKHPRVLFPANDTTGAWVEQWETIIDSPMIWSNFTFLVGFFALVDLSLFRCRVYDGKMINHMYSPVHGHKHPHQMYVNNLSTVPLNLEYDYGFGDVPASKFPVYNYSLAQLGAVEDAAFWRPMDMAAFPTQAIKIAVGAVHSNDGSHMGYFGLVTSFDTVSEFLRDVASNVEGMWGFVVENQGKLIAVSTGEKPYTATAHAHPPTADEIGPNCVIPNPSDPSNSTACFIFASEYTKFPLLSPTVHQFLSGAIVEGQVSRDADNEYFIYAAALNNLIQRDFDMSIYLFYPISKVLSGIEETLNLAVGISVAVAVIAAAITALIITNFMRPLAVLGEQMTLTANLQDDSRGLQPTMMLEIHKLQSAYWRMKAQLIKVKRFVPQALFAEFNDTMRSQTSDYTDVRSTGESSDLPLSPGAFAENPLTDSSGKLETSASTGSVSPMFEISVHSGEKPLNARWLEEEQNVFKPRRCTMLLFQAHKLADDRAELGRSVAVFFEALSKNASKNDGIIDQLNPKNAIVTFNAHRSCLMHAEKAVMCALGVLQEVPHGWTAVIDSCTNFVGTAGSATLCSRIVLGESQEICPRLTTLARHVLQVRLLITERVAQSLQTIPVLPLDIVRLSGNSRNPNMRVYSVVHSKWSADVDAFRDVIAAISQLQLDDALTILNRVPGDSFLKKELKNRINFLALNPRKEYVRKELVDWETFGRDIDMSVVGTGDDDSGDEVGASFLRQATKPDELKGIIRERLDEKVDLKKVDMGEENVSGLIGMFAVQENTTIEQIPKKIEDIKGITWIRADQALTSRRGTGVFTLLGPTGVFAAAKFLPLASDVDVNYLTKELHTASELQHENIVSYISCAVTSHHLALIMDYVSGGSLRQLLRQYGRVPAPLCRRFALEILRGLEFLHGNGILHLDIKPDNVLVTTEGVCKLADFGSSLVSAAAESCTEVDQLRGTAAYVAPEIAQGHKPQASSDVWSFGVLLYEIASGGDSPVGALAQRGFSRTVHPEAC